MAKYITKKQQVQILLKEIEKVITSANVDVAIPILQWTKSKILMDYTEKYRQDRYNSTKWKKYKPRAVKQWEVYGCSLGRNVGSEQNGKSRPVIIAQDTNKCMHSPTVLVIPLTAAIDKNGNKKKKLTTQIEFSHPSMSKLSYIKVEHARCISKARLTGKMCDLDNQTINEIKDMVKIVYDL